jgi:hypothetical protein
MCCLWQQEVLVCCILNEYSTTLLSSIGQFFNEIETTTRLDVCVTMNLCVIIILASCWELCSIQWHYISDFRKHFLVINWDAYFPENMWLGRPCHEPCWRIRLGRKGLASAHMLCPSLQNEVWRTSNKVSRNLKVRLFWRCAYGTSIKAWETQRKYIRTVGTRLETYLERGN